MTGTKQRGGLGGRWTSRSSYKTRLRLAGEGKWRAARARLFERLTAMVAQRRGAEPVRVSPATYACAVFVFVSLSLLA